MAYAVCLKMMMVALGSSVLALSPLGVGTSYVYAADGGETDGNDDDSGGGSENESDKEKSDEQKADEAEAAAEKLAAMDQNQLAESMMNGTVTADVAANLQAVGYELGPNGQPTVDPRTGAFVRDANLGMKGSVVDAFGGMESYKSFTGQLGSVQGTMARAAMGQVVKGFTAAQADAYAAQALSGKVNFTQSTTGLAPATQEQIMESIKDVAKANANWSTVQTTGPTLEAAAAQNKQVGDVNLKNAISKAEVGSLTNLKDASGYSVQDTVNAVTGMKTQSFKDIAAAATESRYAAAEKSIASKSYVEKTLSNVGTLNADKAIAQTTSGKITDLSGNSYSEAVASIKSLKSLSDIVATNTTAANLADTSVPSKVAASIATQNNLTNVPTPATKPATTATVNNTAKTVTISTQKTGESIPSYVSRLKEETGMFVSFKSEGTTVTSVNLSHTPPAGGTLIGKVETTNPADGTTLSSPVKTTTTSNKTTGTTKTTTTASTGTATTTKTTAAAATSAKTNYNSKIDGLEAYHAKTVNTARYQSDASYAAGVDQAYRSDYANKNGGVFSGASGKSYGDTIGVTAATASSSGSGNSSTTDKAATATATNPLTVLANGISNVVSSVASGLSNFGASLTGSSSATESGTATATNPKNGDQLIGKVPASGTATAATGTQTVTQFATDVVKAAVAVGVDKVVGMVGGS